MLYIDHLTKTFGEKKAVDDLTLHIAPGEIYGFIGHNGAGKTTTLKSVVGIQQFDAGTITIGGHSIQADPIACKKSLAYKIFPPRYASPAAAPQSGKNATTTRRYCPSSSRAPEQACPAVLWKE